ncbi:hypothetical protein E2C01_084443 [Portunus trituberculatus]|uniref:Uncharacterized protein n=1 Tax=Portunus trituberculatus TaxID=210409 RepID=A0A5B7IZZ9_PORTR|nr:hypothetical protein [Portunus trituberculatus]
MKEHYERKDNTGEICNIPTEIIRKSKEIRIYL